MDNFSNTIPIVIIPLFKDNFLVLQKKINKVLKFYKALELIKIKAHFTEEGLKIIKDIKINMNTDMKDKSCV